MNKIDLSIIIPCYNVEKYILKCLQSVESLEGINYEIIAVNDGSIDNTGTILHGFKENYLGQMRIVDQENKGLSGARNIGLSIASGRYIFFLDSDDYVNGDELVKFVKSAMDEGVDIGFADYIKLINGQLVRSKASIERLKKIKKNNNICSGIEYAETVFDKNKNYICSEVCFAVFKRDFIIDNKLSFKEGIYHEDTLFFYQSIVVAKKVRYYNICFYIYNIHQGSITTSESTLQKRMEAKYYMAQELMNIKKDYELNMFFIDSYIVNLYYVLADMIKGRNEKIPNLSSCKKLSLRSLVMYGVLKLKGML